jgi:hypothetical protein
MHLDFTAISVGASLKRHLKRALLWYAENQSPSHTHNLFHRFKHLAATVPLGDEIVSTDLINYRSTLDRRTEWYLASVSGFLKRWHEMAIPGVREDAVAFLKMVRLRGNRKGEAVQTMDPRQGRFTDIEFEAVLAALRAASIELNARVLALLFIAFGPRPTQYAALKVCDLAVTSKGGLETYILSIPRAKRREPMARTSFKRRTLVAEIGRVVYEYAAAVEASFKELLPDPKQAPMFPAMQREYEEPAGFEYHRSSASLSQWFRNTMNSLLVFSERTGQPMNINATRFRRTLGSRAADEGHGKLVIADLLDHSDTQNVGPYVEATPGMVERIDKAVALKLAPLAQAFQGLIIENETHATRSGDPASLIADPRAGKAVGNCGEFGFCGSLAPVACYTCRSFEPWLDGPHERVLDFLLAERERLLDHTDRRIAAINDRTILAVAEVVRRCSEITSERISNE